MEGGTTREGSYMSVDQVHESTLTATYQARIGFVHLLRRTRGWYLHSWGSVIIRETACVVR